MKCAEKLKHSNVISKNPKEASGSVTKNKFIKIEPIFFTHKAARLVRRGAPLNYWSERLVNNSEYDRRNLKLLADYIE